MEIATITENGQTVYRTTDGKDLTVTRQAELTSRLFDGGWHGAKDGEEYIAEWDLIAEDEDSNRYKIVYQFEQVKGEEEEPDSLPWDEVSHITTVREI